MVLDFTLLKNLSKFVTSCKFHGQIVKSLKISKGQSESIYRRRTDNTLAKRKSTKEQTTIYKTYI